MGSKKKEKNNFSISWNISICNLILFNFIQKIDWDILVFFGNLTNNIVLFHSMKLKQNWSLKNIHYNFYLYSNFYSINNKHFIIETIQIKHSGLN